MTTDPSAIPMVRLSLADVRDLTLAALRGVGCGDDQAGPVAEATMAAEADGVHSHGLVQVVHFCEHALIGKVDGRATPTLSRPAPGLVRVDAADGFAHPAIDLGLPALIATARGQGISALAVTNSYNCGVVGHHVERIARAGLLALGFVNAPASIAPFGGTRPVFGTNPIALAVPRADADPMVLDQSSSVVAKSEVAVRRSRGEAIPLGWALDRHGQPTTDPAAALDGGTMLPSGGAKGAGLALIVELMAAWITASSLSIDASPFGNPSGGPPRTGQMFLALDPGSIAGPAADARLARLFSAITGQTGARLPGQRRAAARIRTATAGVDVQADLYAKLTRYARPAASDDDSPALPPR